MRILRDDPATAGQSLKFSPARPAPGGGPALLLPASAGPDAARVIGARGLRAFADGFVSVLLPVYLLRLGFDALDVGILTTATLLGSAALTLAVGFAAGRARLPALLLAGAALMVLTGLGFAAFDNFWPLLLVALVGTLNPSAGEVSLFLPLEQTLLAHSVADRDRTALFARYSLAGGLCAAAGTLLVALPDLGAAQLGWTPLAVMQGLFVFYAVIGVVIALIYRRVAPLPVASPSAPRAALGPSRHVVLRLAVLFGIDSFAGGFIVQSMLALWLFQRFNLSLTAAASIFFWINVATALSYLAAVPLARRFGLINVMVFSHLPANLALIAVPFVPELWQAIALLVGRSLLSQMDVPTRSSYVMAVVTPAERPAAASLTSVPRSLASAATPALAGALLAASSFAWPLLIAGTLKVGYDLALLAMFRKVRPPEEGGPPHAG